MNWIKPRRDLPFTLTGLIGIALALTCVAVSAGLFLFVQVSR